jgi:lipase maturation factor 1
MDHGETVVSWLIADLCGRFIMADERPVMVFDADCRFCRRWIARWRRRTKRRVSYLAFQKLGDRYPEISRKACETAVQFRDPNGRIYSGADAVVRLFDFGLPGGPWARRICSVPPLIWCLRLGYAIVARRRQFFSRLFVPRKTRRGKPE